MAAGAVLHQGRVRGDELAVHLDHVGRIAAGRPGGELLRVERGLVELDRHALERRGGVVEARALAMRHLQTHAA